MKRLISIIICISLCSVFLTSCSLRGKLGFDTYDYMSEKVTENHGTIGETADTLVRVLSVLVSDSPKLDTFSDMSGAINAYSDEVLSNMLKSNYSKYSGNTDLMAEAAKKYPQYIITQIIPDREFEAVMYETFGGNVKISNKSTGEFEYLEKVGAYISPVTPKDSDLYIRLTYIGETEKTYKVRFYVDRDGEDVSDEYFSLIIKRDDGTYYIKKLLLSSEVK